MKTLMQYGRLPDFAEVVRRFPVAMAMAALLTVYLMWMGLDLVTHRETGLFGGLILAFYTSTLLQLAAESRGLSGPAVIGAKLALAALSITLCVYWKALTFIVVLGIFAAIVFLGNAAFWRRQRDDRAVWVFTQKLWTGALFAVVGSAIFAIGMVAIMEALQSLFGLDVEDALRHTVIPLGLALLAPAYWLGTLPKVDEIVTASSGDVSFEARALGFLGTWLLAPLTLVYGLIVLAYAVRILVTWELPKGEIAQLVTPFIAIGTFTWLVLEPTVVGDGPLVRVFKRIWFPIALVATTLLLIAVGVRVAEYGLTTERNLLLAFAAAALILGGWFAFRPASDIRIPTAAAAGFFLLSAFVARPLGDVSQFSRLRAALADADSSTVYATVEHLVRQKRQDWVREVLPAAPTDDYFGDAWRSYLVSNGYSPTPDANEYRFAHFRTDYPVDMGGMTELVMQGPIQFTTDLDHSRVFEEDRIEYREGKLSLVVGNTRQVLPSTVDFEDMYATYAMSDRRASRIERNGANLPPYDFTFDDGRRGRLIFLDLQLNGRGDALSGGYGQVLVFRE